MVPRTISDDYGQSGGALAQHKSLVTGEVRGLMLESKLARTRKARLDPHRRDLQFKPGDEVLSSSSLDTTHTLLLSRDKLSPRWMGTFRVLAKTAPNTYRLEVPPSWRAFWEFNVERLQCVAQRPGCLRHPPAAESGRR